MVFKLLRCTFIFILVVSTTFTKKNKYSSIKYAITPEDYPYLALIEVGQPTGSPHYYNGAFASLTWVLTVSVALAQEPCGKPRNDSFFVYGGLGSFDEISSGAKRKIIKVENNLLSGENNAYFPNLVLLRLESAFHISKRLRPAAFNIGMLSDISVMVGWVRSTEKDTLLSHPVLIHVKVVTASMCNRWNLVEFKTQICGFCLESGEGNFMLLEGAFLVDHGEYITALLQFYTDFKFQPDRMPVMILLRLGSFQSFWEFNVIDPSPKQTFLKTNFEDDIPIDPWYKEKPKSAGFWMFSFWTCALNTAFVVVLFIQRNQNVILT